MGHWRVFLILCVLLWQHDEVTSQCLEGALRIQGGASANTGRVEICHDSIWGTVCDDSWGTNDARVVCRQLQYSTGTVRARFTGFTNGVGTIWLDNVRCSGSENRLADCPARPWGDHNCVHSEDAGVTCTANSCLQGGIRLVGGSSVGQGRVEVCNNNVWGTVCDDFWNSPDARVACRQLGYNDTGAIALRSGFSNGAGQIWLDNVRCRGTESRLIDCRRNTLGRHNCVHSEDAGVRCPTCTEGALRLRGGTATRGRLELCHANVWGTVCDHSFTTVAAQVACAQLGYTPDGATFLLGGFTNGVGQIWLDNIRCTGTEARIIDCPADTFGSTNCLHVDDVGVNCISCTHGSVRLQDGASTNEGRVEVCNNNAWGTICEDQWGDADAQVVCRQLNLPSEGAVALTANGVMDGVGTIWLTTVSCVGTETTLLTCPGATILPNGATTCAHAEDIGVRCISSTVCNQGDIRIEGGSTNRGRVEFCNLNQWGTVCDDLWSFDDASVACRQLNFAGGFPIYTGFGNGAPNQRIWLDNVQCDGTEQRLDACIANPIGQHNCRHVEDAGVVCRNSVCDEGAVRIAGSTTTSTTIAGRVEICHENIWGTICDDGWGGLDTTVVCRQLGYAESGSAPLYNGNGYSTGGGQIWLDDVACRGNEGRLLNCPARQLGSNSACVHREDAGVRCRTNTCSTGQIRLIGTTNKGRVEVCRSGAWGSMCQSGWGEANAIVACRQLGFETSGSEVVPGNMTPNGGGTIYTASCTGNENRLTDCPALTNVPSSCSTHNNDVGVFCRALTCVQNSIRIVGTNGYSGRLEVCNDNQWGTVCDDIFGVPDATVACRQLGFTPAGSLVLRNTRTPDGRGKIWLDNVQCVGNETSIFNCPANNLGSHNCRHSEDVGVTCNRGCTQGAIRLQEGSNPTRGRVEICNSNQWGTVCDDLWGAPDARVACRQLGYPSAGAQALYLQNVVDGASGQRIWLDNVRCRGTESRLIDCPRNALGRHNCVHSEDAGVNCQEGTQPFVCAQDNIRLIDGVNEREGRLEVCNDNEWGTVCRNGYGTLDARVVCRQLGYPSDGAQALYAGNAYPAGTGTIWLDNLVCTGRESYLFSCSYRLTTGSNCAHTRDVGARCPAGCNEHAVRVVGGMDIFTGRVEICLSNAWGSVCNSTWTNTEATVVCNQLGFSSLGSAAIFAGYQVAGPEEKIAVDRVSCTGSEDSLASCTYTTSPGQTCTHALDAGVRCTNLIETCEQNALRLAGGNATFGRVEICNNQVWGTICDDFWGLNDARVVCRQLGLDPSGALARYGGFTNGVGQIWLDTVRCSGTESSLSLCRHDGFGNNNCGHLEDAGVWCPPAIICIQGDVRLVDGTNQFNGRVEFCNNNEWGTVCDDNFFSIDAMVVCRQLGFSPESAVRISSNRVPDGNGTIWLDNVACIGTEARLQDCRANPVGVHNCGHDEDVGVRCSTTCDDGDIRLQDGDNSTIGRVEFCFGNVWGTVCDDFWGDIDAKVACVQLGFSSGNATAVRLGNGYTVGNGTQIWLDNVQCAGTESRLIECPSNNIGSHNCQHFEDAGVSCTPGCAQGGIRLQGSESANLGRVEVCMNNIWGTVCENRWGDVDARVVCRQLGFAAAGGVAIYSGFTNAAGDTQIWLSNVQCTGNERRLIDCTSTPRSGNCNHARDAGVTCQPLCIHGEIRLLGGANVRTGRVEVCNDGVWGTVCDDVWGSTDAQVACRQLGYASTGAVAIRTGFTNANASVPVWLDNVNCIGTETKLIFCQGNGIGQHNCVHIEDAGVTCQAGCVRGDIRLRGGTSLTGRVEICNNNVWGTVCDDFWGRLDATVVCRQLGFSDIGSIGRYGGFANGGGQIWLDNVQCSGDEDRLIDCMASPLGTHNCVHNEDAGVYCLPPIVCTQGDIRLQGGNTTCGRVEVCNNNQWGTVCDDAWGTLDANVACRQLGYSATGAQARTSGFPNGAGDVPIWLDNLSCRGSETSLFACAKNLVGINNCDHSEDAGVCCRDGCDFGAVRLLGGVNNREGRVEICYNNVWGTICDDAWGNVDARVVCRQLGLSTNGALRISAGFEVGTGRIWLDQVQCRGNEDLLIACPALPIGNQNCMGDHNEDAGVRCQAGCPNLAVRLAGTTGDALTGRVDFCFNNVWGTVCDDAFGNLDAQVVCRQLGLQTVGAVAVFVGFTNGVGPIWLDDLRCTGRELTLGSCGHRPYGQHNCGHNEDTGVRCRAAVCAEGDLRIRGGLFVGQGRVEICHENIWGTICDDLWGNVDAAVACRQLGFPGGGVLARTGGFTNGAGQIWLDNVACNGRENRLTDCRANAFGVHNCVHGEDAGVLCPSQPCREGSIRLADGARNNTGRLEFCHNNLWGTICQTNFDVNDARVACFQLGFNRTNARVLPASQVRDANGRQVWFDALRCTGNELTLAACPHSNFATFSRSCNFHVGDIGVTCQAFTAICTQGDLRLVAGTNNHTGRLEVCNLNQWGTICDDFFYLVDARVACRQLGFSDAEATPLAGNQVTAAAAGVPIWLDNIFCSGTENRLVDCRHNALGVHNCVHNEDAGVACIDSVCVQSSVRLQGGANQYTGHVEICFNNQWGTICDSGWGAADVRVLCRQLGYSPNGGVALTTGFTNAASGVPIFYNNVRCGGGERRLIDCPRTGGCSSHNNDAGVRCVGGCMTGDVRITGSNSFRFGRIEYCFNNIWGQVCDTQWDNDNAAVACRQLGFSPTGAAAIFSGFQNSVGTIHLDNVMCTGNEQRLGDCPADPVGMTDCTDVQNAGVRCELGCDDGDLRLADGYTNLNGRVEICYNNTWGTICDDFYNTADANVICKQLGFRPTGARAQRGGYPDGTGVIWLSELRCIGVENNITECNSTAYGVHHCDHREDIFVQCQSPQPIPICAQGQVRLVGGTATRGRVEICADNTWGTVCDDLWGTPDAMVVCRQLGHSPTGAVAIFGTAVPDGTGQIWLDNVRCAGTESRLLDCRANTVGVHNCVHREDAGVSCQARTTCTNGDLRLVGGTLAGRLEMCFTNTWGTVCSDGYSSQEAAVACRQLGFSDAGAIPLYQRLSTRDPFTAGTGRIWLDNLNCNASERRLIECPRGRPIGNPNNCNHRKDVGVRCEPIGFRDVCQNGQVRLANGGNPRQGRVEVCYYNQWGTVCDDAFGFSEAKVICKQLGWANTTASAFGSARFGRGSGPIVMDNVACTGNEANLLSCPFTFNHNCNHGEDAGVSCAVVTNSECEDGAVRLNFNRNPRSHGGRVEVCNNHQWGTVCDDDWGFKDSLVVCRQLGWRGISGTGGGRAFYGTGTGNIWLDQVRCQGYEDNIFNCPANALGRDDCTHSEDAGVNCGTGCADGDLRLAGGRNATQGRVEICYGNSWGTVCDDFWSIGDARVVCRQLGFGGQAPVRVHVRAAFGQGTGPIFLDNVQCTGTEDRLLDCRANPVSSHNCAHSEDAGVTCNIGCEQGALRLVGGTASSEGRVEICNDGGWGTVCDDFWGAADASVVCRQLGFTALNAVAISFAAFGQGTGQIVLDNVACSGTEARLEDCNANPLTVHNCAHSEDASVRCSTPCTQGALRLAGGMTAVEGRVEICNNNQWGTVCDDAWGTPDATVVCRQLGFSTTGAQAFSRAAFGRGVGSIVLDQVNCVGTESRLVLCRSNPIGVHDCSHFEDAGVRCQNGSAVCNQGDIRLRGGSNEFEGRVEVCNANAWGTVCDDLWGTVDAGIACRQLGYSFTGATAFSRAFFGQGTGSIWLDNVQCTGSEVTLISCQRNALGSHNCAHSEDAGVRCIRSSTICNTGDLRLVNGRSSNEGRIEVCQNNVWGTVCDDFWSSFDATVACRQLGFSVTGATALSFAAFGQGTGPILLDNLFCTGTQLYLINCTHNGFGNHNCVHAEDAGLRCPNNNTVTCTNGGLRLVGGSNNFQGRVEICWNNNWGTVCDDFWGATDAQVVCRQLGYRTTGATAVSFAGFGQGAALSPIVLDNVGCIGTEARLILCSNSGIGTHNCAHSEDAGVICPSANTPACANGDIRLIGGANIREGRVEFCNNGIWGTVCDDAWDTLDANVVCRQLGFSPFGNSAVIRAFFGQGTGLIWLDNVNCVGTESRLADCPANPIGSHNCVHLEDAGVRCLALGSVTPACTSGDVRLAGTGSTIQGRVEFCSAGVWGTVCDDLWGTADANVVCRQLGFSDTGSIALSFAAFGQGTGPILLDNVGCLGTERRLADCPANPIGSHNCVHFEDASVSCSEVVTVTPAPLCLQNHIRLIGGTNALNGRVEVCNNNAWGTVCNAGFGSAEANVACRQLGFSGSGATVSTSTQGTGQIVLANLRCVGNETSLFFCAGAVIGSNTCTHSQDSGVTCRFVCVDGDIRLVGGTNDREGRVEICNSQVWGTVCDDFWSGFDAGVACIQLGYARTGAVALQRAPFGQGTGPILLDNLFCTSTETRLIDCPHNGVGIHNCVHAEDAGLRCAAGCQTGSVRLVSGTSTLEGRVEICINNAWGTVCDDSWDNNDAAVVCRQLGYSTLGAVGRQRAFYGQGTGTIQLDDVRCTGTESRLIDCPASAIGIHNCAHSEDAGVTCRPETTPPSPPCSDWDLRLVGGRTQREGRVEVCRNATWGTVCDDFWGNPDASVVCAQLGYARNGALGLSFAAFGQGTGAIYLDNVQCTGTELNIRNCSLLTTHNCVHAEDASVICIVCDENSVRLVGSTNAYEGRVEVCINQVWGTVCDDGWGTAEATVACRQVGFSRFGALPFGNARFGQGTGPILLDNVNCINNETRLVDCTNNGVGIHNCAHFEDASVRCNQTLRCNHGALRLMGGGSDTSVGRVEICANETWGTICSDSWNDVDANVACRILGFSRFNATAVINAFYGQGSGPIILTNVACTGNEINLLSCRYSTATTGCTHAEDASIQCSTTPLCMDGDIRLVGGRSMYEGRVELCRNEAWGTVCDDFWNAPDANVVCRQLGFNDTGATALLFAAYGQGTGPILIDDVMCVGTEPTLISCRHITQHNCIHFEDASVRCLPLFVPCSSGDLRLVGGTTSAEGRVEFCQSGNWGTVCDDSWGNADAQVVCRQLGYTALNATAFGNARFGRGTGLIYLDQVRCTGRESRLADCPANPIAVHDCSHSEDAGVYCQVCVHADIRLVSGRTSYEGRVEVCVNNTWGTVCDDFWNAPDAQVVCRQAGFQTMGATALSFSAFGQGIDPILLDDVRCLGTEATLLDCPYNPNHNCIHLEDAGVRCMPFPCQNGAVRLSDGVDNSTGRLEICRNNDWGTVCSTGFDRLESSVVCRQLGFSRISSTYGVVSDPIPQGSGSILLTNLNCTGAETGLANCRGSNVTTGCSHTMDVVVTCRPEPFCQDTDIRLVDGADQYEGRIEICFNETWGTICDGAWSVNDAVVVCRQLGFATTGARRYLNAFFGQGTGPIYLDDFLCTGRESRLISCRNGGLNTIDFCRGHLDDAGVRCAENCTHGEVRLEDGQSSNEGRVGLCFNGIWGTVCDDFFGSPDSQVVCAQLGYSRTGAQAFSFAFFGQGTGPIFIDDVGCRGNEPNILSCSYNPRHNCIHAEDTGVRCQGCANGDVRLVGGTQLYEGRVEVCMGNSWGTVCDDLWGNDEATVVCRQLGFSSFGAIARTQAFFGAGTGQILLDNVQCGGSEDRLIDCTYITMHNCNHGEDAGVTCAAAPRCEEGDLRLANGTTRFNGRVELCLNETWGTVCQDGWDVRDARVVCRQLGFSVLNPAAQFGSAFPYPLGTGPIYYDNAGCVGNEARLLACHYDMNTADCMHTNDVGVDCGGYATCSTGDIRLVNGTSEFEGRVEICVDEVWGTVCDQAWSTFDATVACRQLGFNPVMARPEYDAYFGRGTGPIWLDDLFCNSFETRLIDCVHGGVGMTDFCNGHNDDAGLFCLEACADDQVRLIGGSGPYEGRVEFCRSLQWGTVCHDNWEMSDATVVCRQLGYSVIGATAYMDAFFGPGTGPIYLDNVACIGSEPGLSNCTFSTNTGDCVHIEDASVTCRTTMICSDGDIRLVNGTLPSEGRVEVCLNEMWGTICDTNWGISQAMVVCTSVGFSATGAAGLRSAFFGQGMDPINLDNVVCDGSTEVSILDCTYSTTATCTHSSDASVRCNPTPPVCQNWDLRIVNTNPAINSTGRLEICIRENWNGVCSQGWAAADANVACRQLGYSRFGAVAPTSSASGNIYRVNFACTGNETSLRDCARSSTINCGSGQIQCNSLVCNDNDLRLVDGPSEVEGRVEICYNEVWGSICDQSWSITDANVACLQLGFLGVGSVTYPNARYGQSSGPIYLNNLLCTGNELNLADCDNDGLGVIGSCTHADDAAMFCETPCISGGIRLRDGNNRYEGRVEVCVNEIWGSVCDDFWSGFDARVACRQLGFSEFNATAIPTSRYGVGTGPIHLDDLLCNGFEDRLVDCAYDSNTADCVHFEDAALRCRPCDDGEVRLEGGTSLYNGRVEVCQGQNWFGVCNTYWSAVDATVACRHLGYSGFRAIAYTDGRFGEGQSQILLDQVNCTGSELSLFACANRRQVGLVCPQTSSAGIQCNPQPVCVENSTRLVGGRNDLEGRVEICILETWRTICNTSWSAEDAGVVCRQLGFSRYNASVVLNSTAMFGQGNGAIYAQNVRCHGEEGRLVDCQVDLSTTTCSHAMDAGILCRRELLCQNGDLQLVNGSVAWVGRIEICWNETWGTICDQAWSTFDANVACRQLGYAPIGLPRYNAFYGRGTGPLLLDDLICRNTEQRLIDCAHGGIGNTDFCRGHADDAGLDCRESCTSGAIRLVGGNDAFSGRLEVCKSENWGTVCDDIWDNLDATVACRQLGYSSINSTALVGGQVAEGTGAIHFDNVMCTGTEDTLFDCIFDDTPNCNHREDAGVRCLPIRICENGDLRLVGGDTPMVGRVEICQDEVWGTVCDSLWSSNEGRVTCRQLGYSQFGSVVRSNSFYGPGFGPVTIGSLQCVGSETRLADCPSGDISTCTHTHDAGVACQTKVCSDGDVRLVAGINPREGRVEVCYREQYGTICDIGFGNDDARVVCGQLGFSRIRATGIPGGIFDQGGNSIWLTNLNCSGSEQTLLDCPTPSTIGITGCLHAQDAGVICDPRISYPQNVSANSPTNTTVVVTWNIPLEFYSNITKYSVNCTDGQATREVETAGPNVYTATIPGLSPYTQYRCCSNARYTNNIEDAAACANVVTRQGIPGRPVNLTAVPTDPIRQCGQVRLGWDRPQPSERNGVITGYTYSAMSRGADNTFSQTMFTPNNYFNLTGLGCCTGYEYTVSASTSVGQGTPSAVYPFRTPADNLRYISVSVSIDSRTSLTVSWNIPVNVSSQGLDTVAVSVSPVCVTGLPLEGQQFTTSNENTNSAQFNDLLPAVPYSVVVSVSVCQSLTKVYSNSHFTEEQTLLPPKINVVTRTGTLTSSLTFSASPSDVDFEYYAISLYTASGMGFQQQDLMTPAVSNLTGTPGTLTIDTLTACNAYWVQVTGVTCGGLANSMPWYISVLGNSTYEATMFLVAGQTCDTWATDDRQAQISSWIVNRILRGSTCGFQDVNCIVNTNLSCTKDTDRVTLKVTLASTDVTTSATQLDCLYQWGLNSPGIFVGDIQYTIKTVEVITTTPSPTQAATVKPVAGGGSNLGYVYAIVAIAVVGLIIGALLVIIVVLVIRRRDKPTPRKFDERMLDDQDDVHSTHSIGIVENPLYAEQEEYSTPSYAALKKKEIEADEDFGFDDEIGFEEKGDIHFDPPHDDY